MSLHTRFRLVGTKRTALFEQRTAGEHAQIDVGITATLAQVQGVSITPAGNLTLVLNSTDAKPFLDAPMGAEFDLVISPAKAK